MQLGKTLHVVDRKSWRAWLARNHDVESEIWLVYFRSETGKPRISYNDAVEEALCYGWIDSTIQRVDDESFAQRFSRRRRTSKLSQMNKERVFALIAGKKMTKAGLEAIRHIFDPEKDKPADFAIPDQILSALKADEAAWKNFQEMPESYRRIRVAYIESRKRHGEEHYWKALRHFVSMTARNKRFGFVREMT